MTKTHVVYIVSNVEKSLGFEWIASRLHRELKFTFLLMNPGASPLESFLRAGGIEVQRISFRGKGDYFTVFLRISFFLLRHRPAVVHTHLWDAQLIGLSSAWLTRIRNRIYTRHTSNYHHVYHPSGVKYDRLCNRMATRIVSISQATHRTLTDLEAVPESKIVKIPHGFDFSAFDGISPERVLAVRSKWKIPEGLPTIGVISRLIEWKGVQYVIPAFAAFLRDHPEAHLVLANARGPLKEAISKLLEGIDSSRVTLIPFEEDVAALYRTFDVFVHVPVDSLSEAFGQTYIEALASGVPSIFTLSGIAAEFVEDGVHALLVRHRDSEAIRSALERLWQDASLRNRLTAGGRDFVITHFGLRGMLEQLKSLYNA